MKNISQPNQRPRTPSAKIIKTDPKSQYLDLSNKFKCPPNKNLVESLTENQIELCLDDISSQELRHLPNILSNIKDINCIKLWTKDYEKKIKVKSANRKNKLSEPNAKPIATNPSIMHKFSMFLCNNLAKNPCLQQLCLFGLQFQENSWQQLASGLISSSVLSLVINHCKFSEPQLEILLSALSNQNQLKSLDLSWNELGEKSGYMISRIIGKQGERRDTETWAQSLRGSIGGNSEGLEELIIGYNHIGDHGWEHILTALHCDIWLKYIDIRGNHLTSKSFRETERLLDENKYLLVIDIRDNKDSMNFLTRILNKLVDNFTSYSHTTLTDKYSILYEQILNDQQPDPTFVVSAFKARRNLTASFSKLKNESFRKTTGSEPYINTRNNDKCTNRECNKLIENLQREVSRLSLENERLKRKLEEASRRPTFSSQEESQVESEEDYQNNRNIPSAEGLLSEVDNIIKQLEHFP